MKRGMFVLFGMIFLFGIVFMDANYVEMTGHAIVEDSKEFYLVDFHEHESIDFKGVNYIVEVPSCTAFHPPKDMKIYYQFEGEVVEHILEDTYHKEELLDDGITVTIENCAKEQVRISLSDGIVKPKNLCQKFSGGIVSDGEAIWDGCSGSGGSVFYVKRICEDGAIVELPEHCSAGCTDSGCRESEGNLTQVEKKMPINDIGPLKACAGCDVNGKCFSYGERIESTYCSEKGVFVQQLKSGYSCLKNYECLGESCIDSKCKSNNIFNRFMEWIANLFSGDREVAVDKVEKSTGAVNIPSIEEETDYTKDFCDLSISSLEMIKTIAAGDVEMCCFTDSPGLGPDKLCTTYDMIEGSIVSSSEIRFKRIGSGFIKTHERSPFGVAICNYDFDSGGKVLGRQC